MRRILTTLCLTIAVLLGSAGMSWSADLQKDLTTYQSGIIALNEIFFMFGPHSLWEWSVRFLIGLHVLFLIGVLLFAVWKGNKKIGRLNYFIKSTLLSSFLFIVNVFYNILDEIGELGKDADLPFFVHYTVFIINCICLFFIYRFLSQRLRDCGRHRGWAFAALFPVVGFIIYVYALFGKSKVLDYEEGESSKLFAEIKKHQERIEPTFGKRDD